MLKNYQADRCFIIAEIGGNFTTFDQAKRLKDLEVENARLKRAVADLTVDKLILKEVAEGKY